MSEDALRRFRAYDFDSDENFQAGLKDILLSVEGRTQEEREHFIEQAKAFYFSNITGIAVEDLQSGASSNVDAGKPEELPPLTFAELSELIQSGQTHLIPNNREIPAGTSSENPSNSNVKDIPRKPWEK